MLDKTFPFSLESLSSKPTVVDFYSEFFQTLGLLINLQCLKPFEENISLSYAMNKQLESLSPHSAAIISLTGALYICVSLCVCVREFESPWIALADDIRGARWITTEFMLQTLRIREKGEG